VNNIYITTSPIANNNTGDFSAIIGDEPLKKKKVVKKKKNLNPE
jgi:hypothetical protein